jgi:hypothetical protein
VVNIKTLIFRRCSVPRIVTSRKAFELACPSVQWVSGDRSYKVGAKAAESEVDGHFSRMQKLRTRGYVSL